MDSISQYRPHPRAAFEGYYFNFQLQDGERIILIICTVRGAKKRPDMICFIHCPSNYKTRNDVYHREIWVDRLDMLDEHLPDDTFVVETPSGRLVFNTSITEVHIDCPGLKLTAKINNRKRLGWLPGNHDTPEGILALLPLPLHWQVYSLSSPAEISWKLDDTSNENGKSSGENCVAHVHQEKNWANGFPSAHVWIQARCDTKNGNNPSGINVAGGSILGLHAYLMTYHSTNPIYSTSTRPPFSMLLFPSVLPNIINPTSLTTSESISYSSRTVHLEFLTTLLPLRKIVIHASADPASFFPMSAPFPEGHRPNFLAESMRATVIVRTFEVAEKFGVSIPFAQGKRVSFGTHWNCVHEDVFENAGLEFGGEWYGDRG